MMIVAVAQAVKITAVFVLVMEEDGEDGAENGKDVAIENKIMEKEKEKEEKVEKEKDVNQKSQVKVQGAVAVVKVDVMIFVKSLLTHIFF